MCVIASGCAVMIDRPGGPPPPVPPQPGVNQAVAPPRQAGPLDAAETAYNARNFANAARLYAAAARNAGFDMPTRRQAWERYARSAILSNQPSLALEALKGWRAMEPQATNIEAWQSLYAKALRELEDSPAKTQQLQAILDDTSLPSRLKAMAGVSLAAISLRMADLQSAKTMLEELFSAYGNQHREDLELALYEELATMPGDVAESLLLLIPQGQRGRFPATIIRLDSARRLAATNPAGARQIAESLQGAIANTELFAEFLGDASAAQPQVTAPSGGVAIAVPLSGPFGNIGWKIVRGAGVAREQLAARGIEFAVQPIDTEKPDWLDQLRALPSSIAVVGGPLRTDRIQALVRENLRDRFAFFAFANGIGTMTEGRDAWRFFSSPEDQVRALLDFARNRAGASSVGILSPGDDFAQRMTELFEREAFSRGLAVTSTQTYTATDRNLWYDEVGSFLQSGEFQAVFLPAGFDQAEIMLPNFIYHQRRDLTFLGPSIWGQALARGRNIVERDFQNAVFPWAWRMEAMNGPASVLATHLRNAGGGDPDLWSAIGFDFVRFIHTVGQVSVPVDPGYLNNRLSATNIEWSMAPIRYDSVGRASQELFIFRPTRTGYTLFDTPLELAPASSHGQPPTQGASSLPSQVPGQPQGQPQAPRPAPGQAQGQTSEQLPGQPQGTPEDPNAPLRIIQRATPSPGSSTPRGQIILEDDPPAPQAAPQPSPQDPIVPMPAPRVDPSPTPSTLPIVPRAPVAPVPAPAPALAPVPQPPAGMEPPFPETPPITN